MMYPPITPITPILPQATDETLESGQGHRRASMAIVGNLRASARVCGPVKRLHGIALGGFVALLCVVATAAGQPAMPGAGGGQPSGMPNAQMMSGIPMPMADVPDGTVSVRVVRGEISNIVPGQQVELAVDGMSRTAKTDESGRAQFTGIPPGRNLKAVVTVDGEWVESQAFTMPDKGGIRLLLATTGAGASSAAPAVTGTVVFGGETRIVVEFDDDSVNVFYLIDVVNNGAAPVNSTTPIVFDLPPDAISPTVLEGSSPQAQVKGTRVTFAGPFKPGRTSAQIAYQLGPADGGERALVQRFPAALDMVSVAVQQVGGVRMSSPAIAQQQQVTADGKPYLLGNGPSLPAGRPLTLELSGLPHHEAWPRTLALILAGIILAGGVWAALGSARNGAAARRRELEQRRDRLFADLVRLEQAKRAGAVEAQECEARRRELLATLERIYGELDIAAPPAIPAATAVTPDGQERPV
jgi:hypothetical protein